MAMRLYSLLGMNRGLFKNITLPREKAAELTLKDRLYFLGEKKKHFCLPPPINGTKFDRNILFLTRS